VANKAQEFKQHHITRGLKAALAAGVQNPSVSVRMPNGAVLSVGAGPDRLPKCHQRREFVEKSPV
jgi:hypothetical protein